MEKLEPVLKNPEISVMIPEDGTTKAKSGPLDKNIVPPAILTRPLFPKPIWLGEAGEVPRLTVPPEAKGISVLAVEGVVLVIIIIHAVPFQ